MVRNAARIRMRIGPLCGSWKACVSCPGRVQPPVAADPERQHHGAAPERCEMNAAGPGIRDAHGREAQRGCEECEEDGELLRRRRGHWENRNLCIVNSQPPTPNAQEQSLHRTGCNTPRQASSIECRRVVSNHPLWELGVGGWELF